MGFEPVDLGDPDLNREANMLLAELDNSPPVWWWMSFADPARPEGDRFLGVAMVLAPNPPMAMKRAWELKINPGGQIQFSGPFTEEQVPVRMPRYTLLDRETLDRLGA